MKLKPVDQQVVVVVGCTSGIGLETALRFARKGAKLILVGRGQEDLDRTLDEVRREGAEAATHETDVASWEGLQAAAQHAVDTFGHIDTWAHVAGVPYYAQLDDTPPEEFRRVIEVNLNGPTFGVMAALPHLKREGRGAIIVVTSVDAKIPVPYQGAYSAAKHGLVGMLDTLRLELKHEGVPISITNIMPATIDTPFFVKAKDRVGFEPNAMPPVYDPASVADAIVYAASHPVRDINVGSASFLYQFARRLNPKLSDAMIEAAAFKAQQTDIPKREDTPNNLYNHLPGYHQVESKYPAKYSWTTWMQLHPVITSIAGVMLLAALPVGIYFLIRSRRMARKRGLTQLNLGDIAFVSAISSMVSRLPMFRKQTLPQKIASRAQDMMPVKMFRRQSAPEKFMSKASDVFSKAMPFAHRKSFAEKTMDKVLDLAPVIAVTEMSQRMIKRTADRVKDMAPFERFDGHRKSLPNRVYNAAKDTVEDTISSIRG